MKIGTDIILDIYSISRHNLNILIKHDPCFIGYLGTDTVWNGQAYIQKHIFDSSVKITKEQVKIRLEEIKAQIKEDRKVNTTDEDLIEARKRTLNKNNRKYITKILEGLYNFSAKDERDRNYIHNKILDEIDKVEKMEQIEFDLNKLAKIELINFELDKQRNTASILKSNTVNLKLVIDVEEWDYRVDEREIFFIPEGDEIEWEKGITTVYTNLEIIIYKYKINDEVIGVDYKILSAKNNSKYEVVERYTTLKY
ncbi:hypothetical protein [Intestinibacter bartlettii]|uniref:hypothetical protein n=1 Tax=Intestinibacter bartlettii TaxID=261299 RepID=UPI0039946338